MKTKTKTIPIYLSSEIDLQQNKYYEKIKRKSYGVKISTGFEEYEFDYIFELLERDLVEKLKGKGQR